MSNIEDDPELDTMPVALSNSSFERYSADDFWNLCFHSAASLGVLNCIEDFIERQHVDVDQRNKDNWTALMYASYYGHEAVVTYLLQHNAQLNGTNKDGHTSLMLATMCGRASIANKLLQKGCALELRDMENWTALFHATHAGYDYIVKLLLCNGADINCREPKYGFTPLMIAAKEGLEITVDTFLQHGADISLKSFAGETAQSLAFVYGHMKVVALLDRHISCSINDSAVPSLLGGPIAVENLLNQLSLVKKNGNCVNKPSSTQVPSLPISSSSDLKSFLERIGLTKYSHVFEEQDVDFPIFLTLSDEDLQEIGIKLLGPRKKICSAISRWQNNAQIGNSIEQAYADKLAFELKIANRKLSLAQNEIKHLKSELDGDRLLSKSTKVCTEPAHDSFEAIITECKTLHVYVEQLQDLLYEWHTNYSLGRDSSSLRGSSEVSPSKNNILNYQADFWLKQTIECLSSILSKLPSDIDHQ